MIHLENGEPMLLERGVTVEVEAPVPGRRKRGRISHGRGRIA